MAKAKVYLTTVPFAKEEGTPPSVVFDAVLSLNPVYSQSITGYTLSDGSPISNHTTGNNNTYSMTGVVTTQPFTPYAKNLIGYETLSDRPQKAYDKLKEWKEKKVDLYLAFEYDTKSPLIITELSPVQNGTDSLTFNITLEEARRVSYARTILVQNVTEDLSQTGAPSVSGKGKTKEKNDLTNLQQLWQDTGKFADEVIEVEVN
ncbi:hypothetical protein VP277E431_P0058 [Vibrio phage 277E43-1]|nr:hypothetical protein VP277E431_P0058 [Vibrio phage 277E43-1]